MCTFIIYKYEIDQQRGTQLCPTFWRMIYLQINKEEETEWVVSSILKWVVRSCHSWHSQQAKLFWRRHSPFLDRWKKINYSISSSSRSWVSSAGCCHRSQNSTKCSVCCWLCVKITREDRHNHLRSHARRPRQSQQALPSTSMILNYDM